MDGIFILSRGKAKLMGMIEKEVLEVDVISRGGWVTLIDLGMEPYCYGMVELCFPLFQIYLQIL